MRSVGEGEDLVGAGDQAALDLWEHLPLGLRGLPPHERPRTRLRFRSSPGRRARRRLDPEVMGGRPCVRGLRVTVGTIVGLVASGHTHAEILQAYPYLEEADIREALAYAAGPQGVGA